MQRRPVIGADRARTALVRRAMAERAEVLKRLRAALGDAGDRASIRAAEEALRAGNPEAAAKAILSDISAARLGDDLKQDEARLLVRASRIVMQNDVPKALRTATADTTGYTTGYTAGIDALGRMSEQLATPFIEGAERGVLAALETGIRLGVNPRTLAREVRDGIGLTEFDWRLVNNFQAKLRTNPGAALENALRSTAYDPALLSAEANGTAIAEAKIGSMVGAYTDRLLTWRAETFTRTTTLNAMREGTLTAWQDAGEAADAQMTKTWVTTLDGREREGHFEMHGVTVPIDEPWDVPDAGREMTPGDLEYNCRCAMTFALA